MVPGHPGPVGQLAVLACRRHRLRQLPDEIWRRWPASGTPEPLGSRAEYERLVGVLLKVCLTVDDAVAVAGLVRALVRTCHAEALDGAPPPLPRSELIRMATWRAARYGLEDNLIDVVGERSLPAADMLATLLGFIRPALEEHDEWEVVSHPYIRSCSAAPAPPGNDVLSSAVSGLKTW